MNKPGIGSSMELGIQRTNHGDIAQQIWRGMFPAMFSRCFPCLGLSWTLTQWAHAWLTYMSDVFDLPGCASSCFKDFLIWILRGNGRNHSNKQTNDVASMWLTVFTCTKRLETLATIQLYLPEVSWDNLLLTVMLIAMKWLKCNNIQQYIQPTDKW